MRIQRSVVFVAAVSIIAGLFGLYYNGEGLLAAFGGRFSDLVAQQKLTGFYAAFYTMSGICMACYLLLLASGVNLLRGLLRWSVVLTAVVIFEVLYFFAIGALWLSPFGMSVGAATGVANGGLMVQFLVLFPLWAPVLLWRARRRATDEPLES
jgi:hypothetical protein